MSITLSKWLNFFFFYYIAYLISHGLNMPSKSRHLKEALMMQGGDIDDSIDQKHFDHQPPPHYIQ